MEKTIKKEEVEFLGVEKSINNILKIYKIEVKGNKAICPFHADKEPSLTIYPETNSFFCFGCRKGGDVVTFVMMKEGCNYVDACKKLGIELKGDKFEKAIRFFVSKRDLAEQFIKIQPLYYDNVRIWWYWNFKEFFWEIIDETDILNMIEEQSNSDTIKSHEKRETLEALKQVCRKNKPKDAERTWIQFKDKIVDIATGKQFKATPKYFITNPISWELGLKDDTPTMDKIFEEWVGEKYVKTLYEILAYSLVAYMPLHRIFCFVGGGLNGKGTFLRLVEKFVGHKNVTSTDLDLLSRNNFESSKLYKKLIVMIGEVDKSIFTKTSTIKRITGDDLTRIEYKGKDGFDTHLYAKPLVACNKLPETTDKTVGFFRRWLIIDFPNRFNEKQDILNTIPLEEYNNLAKKSLVFLKELGERGEFTNDGSIEEKEEKYEKHSNPLNEFIENFCKKDINANIVFDEFYEKFKDYLVNEKYRVQSKIEVGKALNNRNFEKKIIGGSDNYGNLITKLNILGIRWGDGI